jgi:hypothetical protein
MVFVLGCNNSGIKSSNDMSMSIVDMAVGPDMAMRLPDGVACGASKCDVGKTCCVDTMAATTTCVASPAACNASAFTCDGPEDCTGGTSQCCTTVDFTLPNPDAGVQGGINGANAMCVASCQAAISGSSLTTRLCHQDVDCKGLAINFGISIPLEQCCSSTLLPGAHFCASSTLSQFGGGQIPITCP